jgi:hypothetical protein
MSHSHAVVWIDHHEAHVTHFNLEEAEATVVKPPVPQQHHLHHKRGAMGSGHDKPDAGYLSKVAAGVADVTEILICGPAGAKLELFRYLQDHHKAVADRVVGVETVDHPTDGELLRFARKYFIAADRMRGTSATLTH